MPSLSEIAEAINIVFDKDDRRGNPDDRTAYGVLEAFMDELVVTAAMDPDEQAHFRHLVQL